MPDAVGPRPENKKMLRPQAKKPQNQLEVLNWLRHKKELILVHHLSNKETCDLQKEQLDKKFDLQKEQLDKKEAILDKEIASLEKELHLTKEEKEEGGEFVHGSIIRDLLKEDLEDVDENLAAGASDVKKEEESSEEAEETRYCVKCGCMEWFQRLTEECCWKEYGIDCVFKEESQETASGQAWQYARKWHEQGGDAVGIPKQYTPCLYFFKAKHGCQRKEACQFSHNGKIFRKEPFSTMVQLCSWKTKERKSFTQPRPCQEKKKRRRADEE